MKDDFLIKRIIIYGTGVLCICAWAVFRIIPYNIAMYLATASFIYCMFIEAKQDRSDNKIKSASKKMGLCVFLTISLLLILVLNP
ncbi:MAG: hypothetical protein EOM50_04040 [Erysipelotrichia bacterium]|nr:hypothetical protein [Erysipelotrichia bacterium]NCC54541.1 hypothetical protein [Erysipelotrichia bacterium]